MAELFTLLVGLHVYRIANCDAVYNTMIAVTAHVADVLGGMASCSVLCLTLSGHIATVVS